MLDPGDFYVDAEPSMLGHVSRESFRESDEQVIFL